MNFNEYQKLAQRTSNTKCSVSKLINGVMGLNSESGECIDLIKKNEFQGHDLDINKLIDGLGNVLWYIAETCEGIGVTIEDVARHNIVKLKKTCSEGFEADRNIYLEIYIEETEELKNE